MAVGLAAVLSTASLAQAQQAPAQQAPAQQAPAQQPPAQQQPAPAPPADAFKFATDAALIIWIIKPASAADFESVWSTIRGKLATAENAEFKTLGDSMRVYKGDATPEGVTYFFTMDPVSKNLTYNPTFLLYETKLFERAQADELFKKLSESIAQIRPVGMSRMP
jgi:hypothetical protein